MSVERQHEKAFLEVDSNATFSRVNFEYHFSLADFRYRPAEISPPAACRTLVGRAERDRPAKQLRADLGHGVRRLPRRHHVEPEHAAERGLPVCERGGAATQA